MKIKTAIITMLFTVAVVFGQATVFSTVDTSKAAIQKTQLKKIVNVTPRKSTNWSKIKDLFM
jgi:hypothetical protein